jgi:predicted helicase
MQDANADAPQQGAERMAVNVSSHKSLDTHYAALATYAAQGVGHESATRLAFSTLLDTLSKTVGWTLVPEQALVSRKRPDGTLLDSENITDWALAQFQGQYGAAVTKRDIFNYVYAVLYHPQYRERYAENLKRELPRILLVAVEDFTAFVETGAKLAELHLGYERAPEFPLTWVENKDIPFSWHVTKMKLTPAMDAVIVNESLTLAGIPPECFAYRLGNRSALEWVIDQYQVSTDKRSGIVSDPNREDDEEYIARLVGRVVTVSVETVKLIAGLLERVVAAEAGATSE